MKVTVVLAAVAAMIVSAVFVVKLLGERPPTIPPAVYSNPTLHDQKPDLAEPVGPHPTAVVDEPEHSFGRMMVGEERTHEFFIRNEGDALLIVEFGDTTCQCTYSSMKKGDKLEIPPGQSGSVNLKWKPTQQAEIFDKGATLLTNDVAHSSIRLKILGMVTPRFMLNPEKDWTLSDSLDGKPFTFTGRLGSPILEQFGITAIESRSSLVSAEAIAMNESQLEDGRARSGYQIRVSVKPEMPMGAFSYPLTIKTDVPEITLDGTPGKLTEFEVLLTGALRGPIRPTGREWMDDKMAISLGAFEAAAGKKVSMPVLIKNPPADGFKLTEPPVCIPEALKFDMRQDEKSTAASPRFHLTLEYPPGSPRVTHRDDSPARVIFKTNHPHAERVEFLVFLSAY
jgi:hypothetical protein